MFIGPNVYLVCTSTKLQRSSVNGVEKSIDGWDLKQCHSAHEWASSALNPSKTRRCGHFRLVEGPENQGVLTINDIWNTSSTKEGFQRCHGWNEEL